MQGAEISRGTGINLWVREGKGVILGGHKVKMHIKPAKNASVCYMYTDY